MDMKPELSVMFLIKSVFVRRFQFSLCRNFWVERNSLCRRTLLTGELCAECEGSRLYRYTDGSVVSIATRYGVGGPCFETH